MSGSLRIQIFDSFVTSKRSAPNPIRPTASELFRWRIQKSHDKSFHFTCRPDRNFMFGEEFELVGNFEFLRKSSKSRRNRSNGTLSVDALGRFGKDIMEDCK
jgi:hypothetical protein